MTAAQPYGEEFWQRDSLTIAAKTNREFQHLLHACVRAAPNWAQVERLRGDNAVRIKHLDAATMEDVNLELDDREKELRDGAISPQIP